MSAGTAGKAIQVETQGRVGCHSQAKPGATETRASSRATAQSGNARPAHLMLKHVKSQP